MTGWAARRGPVKAGPAGAVAKHAHASVVNVEVRTHDAILQLAIRDDGIGGADLSQGSALLGLGDRIEALGGTLQLTSPPTAAPRC